jgi:hypothetical protein
LTRFMGLSGKNPSTDSFEDTCEFLQTACDFLL